MMTDRFPSRATWSQMASSLIDRELTIAEAVVGVVDAVAEAVDAERAGVLAGRHAHPGRHGDRRDDALQPAVAAGLHQAADVRQPLVAEEQLGGGAVESDDQDLHEQQRTPFHGGALGDAQGVEDRRGQVDQPRPRRRGTAGS